MNRQKSIKVRLTESEYELLKKQANGSPMASYMRSVCLGNSQTPSKIPQIFIRNYLDN